MAIAAQQPRPDEPIGGPWPAPDLLQRLAPIMRLIAAIGAVPQVTRISMSTRLAGVDLWVFMTEDDYDAEARISRAERDFLNSGLPPIVEVQVVPGKDIDPEALPPQTVLFER